MKSKKHSNQLSITEGTFDASTKALLIAKLESLSQGHLTKRVRRRHAEKRLRNKNIDSLLNQIIPLFDDSIIDMRVLIGLLNSPLEINTLIQLTHYIQLVKSLRIHRNYIDNLVQAIVDFQFEVNPLFQEKIKKSGLKYTSLFLFWCWHQRNPLLEGIQQTEYKRNLDFIARKNNYSYIHDLLFSRIIQYLPEFVLNQFGKFTILWILHLGLGKNIRKIIHGIYFDKKMAHIFHNLKPQECSVAEMYFYCLVKSMGFSNKFYQAIRHVFNYNITHPYPDELIANRVPLLLEILQKLKAWNIEAQLGSFNLDEFRGYISHLLQDRPNFSMKGRTLESFLRLCQSYYDQQLILSGNNLIWEGATYQSLEEEVGGVHYKIIQINNSLELKKEGANMRHCVGGYGSQCANNQCSIWSLRTISDIGEEVSQVTLEINNHGKIVQAKARYNQLPNYSYLKIIKEWAEREGLQFVRA